MMRTPFGAFAFLLVLAFHATLLRAADASAPRPNVIFIFIDDMGCADLGCFGGPADRTPNVDKLAREGIRFTQFYVNSPICSPSRVAVTTGQYPARWKITSYLDKRQTNRRRGIANWLPTQAPTLARMLHDAGYYTAHVGKWHMGGQRDVGNAPLITAYGFDTSLTNFEGLGERLLPKFDFGPERPNLRHEPTHMSAALGGPIHWVDREKVSERYVDRALEEIGKAQKAGKPFYLNLWPDDVHSPVQAPAERRGDGSPRAQYAGVLAELDRQLGRVFDHVRSDPTLRDNTVILLASDNGPEPGLGSCGSLRGQKGNLYEGGIRSPLIVWCPTRIIDAARGSTNDRTLLAGMDIPPSILALTKVAPTSRPAFDGLDMSAAMIGEDAPQRREPILWVRPPDRPGPEQNWPDLAIRDGRWKLLVMRDGSRAELFDIPADPNEKRNLAADHPDLVTRLSERVRTWDRGIRSK